jgi:cytochrome c-type biogenesis protein CcmE
MTAFSLRWSALVVVAVILTILTSRYVERHLASLTPDELLVLQPTGSVRVLGLVKGGTLAGELESGHARFELSGDHETLSVQYDGPPPENLRELKTLIVVGQWDPASSAFQARDIALVTNYGFVMGAYAVGVLPLALFLFMMERRVGLLYREIKQSKLYEPEAGDVEPR